VSLNVHEILKNVFAGIISQGEFINHSKDDIVVVEPQHR